MQNYANSNWNLVRMSWFAVCLFVSRLFVPVVGPFASGEELPSSFECRFANEPPLLDGKADEPAWSSAEEITTFSLPWLQKDARRAKTATRARLLWDHEYLYFFADMDDADLYADVTDHDGITWENDVFELFFKPADDRPGYFEFQVNAANTPFDMFVPRRGSGGTRRYARADEFHLESRTVLRGTLNKWQDRDQGWSVEGRIPWTDFVRAGGRPDIGEQWKFVLCRYDYSTDFEGPELSWCSVRSSTEHPDFHHFEDYADLRFVGPAPKNAALPQFQPLSTSRVAGSPDPPLPYQTRPRFTKPPLSYPIAATLIPGRDEWLVVVQSAAYATSQLVRMKNTRDVDTAEKLIEIPDTTAYCITFHPRYRENGWVYVGCNGPGSTGFKGKTTKVIRYHLDPGSGEFAANSATTIIEWESDGHNGGAVTFGLDGMMYVTSGDGTSDSDTNLAGQNLTHLLGKVLRIDVERPTQDHHYSVPGDNPFVGQDGIRPETWCYGLRNPWRICTDPVTGHIWVGNNGQDLWEQAYLIQRGANYGWSVMEGSHAFYPDRKSGPTEFTKPTVEHPHSEARSLTGGFVYYGRRHPDLRGAYIYGDHSTGKVWGVKHDGKRLEWHRELVDTPFHITGFAVDADGEVLIIDHAAQGNFHDLEPTPPLTDQHPAFPRRLSETGLFQSIPAHELVAGMIPYSVNSPLWSDGAHKERALGIPGAPANGQRIDFSVDRGWGFPDESVIVKSFALDMQMGDPKTRRWIETRILVKQQGEWLGYTYKWLNDQSDAELVENNGADQDFEIRVPRSREFPNGIRTQLWHYPSRTECMVCHSRAANYVLGLTTAQMNREHNYGDRRENQLHVFERLGLLKVNWMGDQLKRLREEWKASGADESMITERAAQWNTGRDQREANSSSMLAYAAERYQRLVDPYDVSQNLDSRARSYLHANCSQCHVEAGGGNAQINLEAAIPFAKTNMLDEPRHHRFGIASARIVAPGAPERSVLLHRVSQRGPGKMPQLATEIVDHAAVEMLTEWIRELGK